MSRQTIVVYGNPQAEAIALILKSLPAISAEFDVEYINETGGGEPVEALRTCAVLCEQLCAKPFTGDLPKKAVRVRFPPLEFYLLWPLNCVNPFNRIEPPQFPFGRFPYGDSFIVSCIRQGMPAAQILRHYAPLSWPATWPDLNRLFQSESARLSALDARSDVKIGSFILKYFRRRRLFWAANSPSNTLLEELVYRLLHAAFGPGQPSERSDIEKVLASFGARDLLGAMSVPIHPLVAKQFQLEWFNAGDRYAYFGNRELTYDEYFAGMIEQASAEAPAAPAK